MIASVYNSDVLGAQAYYTPEGVLFSIALYFRNEGKKTWGVVDPNLSEDIVYKKNFGNHENAIVSEKPVIVKNVDSLLVSRGERSYEFMFQINPKKMLDRIAGNLTRKLGVIDL
jgi:hypothetical protein